MKRLSARLSARDAQQQVVQAGQRLVAGKAAAAERRQPLRRLIAGAAAADNGRAVDRWHDSRSYEPAETGR